MEGWEAHQHATGGLELLWRCSHVLGGCVDIAERPLERTTPVVRRGPGGGIDDIHRRGRTSRRMGGGMQQLSALGKGNLPSGQH